MRSGIALGAPERVAELIVAFGAAAEAPVHYIARLYWPGMDPGLQREAINVCAEGVLSLLHSECQRDAWSSATTASAASGQTAPRGDREDFERSNSSGLGRADSRDGQAFAP